MKSITVFTILLTVLLIGNACRQRDIQTVTIEVPQLQGQECKQLLREVVSAMNGVRTADLVVETGSVTVTYDSMRLALKNLEYAIAGTGFQANEIPADPKARERLPELCR